MDWARYKHDWPMAETSDFVLNKPHRWHVQRMGTTGPCVLFLHGAGGSTQSWRHLMPLLSPHMRAIAIDLPGQGFTKSGAQQRAGLWPMAEDIAALCAAQDWQIDAIIGHSAGAAIALELAPRLPRLPVVVGLNAALGNFQGLAGVLFPLMAKALAMMPGVAAFFTASTARPGSVARLIEGTGSKLSTADLRFYQALVSNREHVDATLSMMAQWDLNPLLQTLPDYAGPLLLIAAENDKAVPPQTSQNVAHKMARAEVTMLPGLGHLAHEEDAAACAAPILAFLTKTGVLEA